ncbi:MAG: vWA domain-containing protein [Nanoarchaeota archaeon]
MAIAKRGIFFIIDVLFAIMLILVGVFIASQYFIDDEETSQSELLALDSVDFLGNIKVEDLNGSIIDILMPLGTAPKMDNTVLEQIAYYWIQNDTEAAETLASIVLGDLIPERYGYAVVVGGNIVHSRNISTMTSLRSSAQMVSGIEEFKPIEGFTANVFLASAPNRRVSSFAYFGGFIGEGNLSTYITLPENYSTILEVYFEGAISTDIDVYFNNVLAESFTKQTGNDLEADKFYFNESTFSLLMPGQNIVNITFRVPAANQSIGYIGGGYLRVSVNSSDYFDPRLLNVDNATQRIYIPGVDGLINMYSSFYIGGELHSMSAFLHYKSDFSAFNDSNFSIYLNVGNITMHLDNNVTEEKLINISNQTFANAFNFTDLSGQTIPIRIGSNGINYSAFDAGNSDVIIITDLSQSMQWALNSTDTGDVVVDCDDPEINESTVRRISLAKCLDILLINTIMNRSTNRVGLVGYGNNANKYHELSTSRGSLIHEINTYPNGPGGGTCICCGLNRAYELFADEYNSTREHFIILMSDGIPGRRCTSVGACDTNWTGTEMDGSWCCNAGTDDCNNPNCNGPVLNSIWSAARVHDDLNVTIHAVGFGPVDQCMLANQTLYAIAESGEGDYYVSDNASRLHEIYQGFGESILSFVYEAQAIIFTGDLIKSQLYPDSYIELNFTPFVDSEIFGQLPLTVENPPFNNNYTNGTFSFPPNATLIDARVTSYSGNLWTVDVEINNGTETLVPYNLTRYGDDYLGFGDPFVVEIPPSYLSGGVNTSLNIHTGSSPSELVGGSVDDRLIYTILVKTSAGSEGVGSLAEGCAWELSFEEGADLQVLLPGNYSGPQLCYYSNASYNLLDAIDSAAYNLFKQLDLDQDGLIDVRFDENSLETNVLVTTGVPYLWGPTLVEVRIWQ